ncbi:MAG: hypothetical protein KDB10_15255, partial [Acidimicrobiales bacterium]|nr:hypothetical protein [Acidimicrobiales bacterium]
GEMGDALPAVPLGRPAVAITAGLLHTCALLDDGRVSCWGYGGASGGVGAFGTVPLGTSRTAIALSAGGGHTCALLDDHTVKCWGANGDGQLGLGDLAPRGASSSADMGDNLPPVDLGVGRTALGVSAGASSTCALLDDHTVKCWGANGFGQLGQGGTARLGDEPGELGDDLPPVALGTGRTALSVTSGERHTCAVRDDRGLRCWGANPHGELGIGRGVERVGDDPGEMGDALPPVDVAGTGRGVTGVVTDAATGAAIPEALVGVLAAPDYAPVGTGVTDRRGRFGVDTPAGSYLVYAVAGGRSGFHGEPTPVTVTAAYAPADVETRTGRGVIEGRVVDGTGGAPIAGAWVLATDAATGDPARGTVQVSDGFQVTGLVARPHHLIAIDPTGAHPPRAHPSAPTPAGSVPVDVMADAVTEADVTLPPTTPAATTAALSGRVDLDGGSGRSGVWVLAFRAADLAFVRGTVSENDGRWLLWVPPGEYKVAFVDPDGTLPMEWYGDQGPGGVADATPVTAPRNGVVAALTPTTGTIRAIVTRNGIPWSHVWVAAIGPHGVAGTDALRGVDDYTIGGLPVGTYRLAFVEPPGVRTEYWSDGPTYALADPVTVTAGGTTTVSGDLAAPP